MQINTTMNSCLPAHIGKDIVMRTTCRENASEVNKTVLRVAMMYIQKEVKKLQWRQQHKNH